MKRSSTSITESPRYLVYVTGDRIGDGLLKYPVLKAFRAALPGAHLTWITGRNPSVFLGRLKPLVDGLLDEVHERVGLDHGSWSPTKGDFRGRYEAVVCTESRLWPALQLKRLDTCSYVSPALRFMLSTRKPTKNFVAATSFERFRILMELAIGRDLPVDARIDLDPGMEKEAERRIPGKGPFVGLSPGAGGPSKRWPLERFVLLAHRLVSHGAKPVFFLGPEEADFERCVRQEVPGALLPERCDGSAMERTPLFSVALARRMCFSVANDSGGGHLIAAGGRPLLTLFGHTSAAKFRSPYCDHYPLSAAAAGYGSLEELAVDAVEKHLVEIGLIRLLS